MKSKWLFIFVLAAAGVYSLPALQGSARDISVFAQILRLLADFFPPDFSILPDIAEGLQETFQIAFWATLFAVIVSLPLSLLASRKISGSYLSTGFLVLISAVRTIPSLIWAIIWVALLGPYPLAGVIALSFYSVSYLAKFFTDTLDSINFQSYDWLKQHGIKTPLAFYYSLWPELRGLLFSQSLWMFEYNMRSAAIIGYVGAGGLGLKLHAYQEFGQWDRFSAVLIVIFVLVLILERLSSLVKKKSQS